MQTLSTIQKLLEDARIASSEIRMLSNSRRQSLLLTLAEKIELAKANIISENEKDLIKMKDSNPKKDRLSLTPERIQGLVDSVREVAALADPVGNLLSEKHLENGLLVQKLSVPMGVVGMIYESRPNVTIDVAALCLRSGNGAVLRGGSDAFHSNTVLVKIIHEALLDHRLSPQIVQLLPTDRAFVQDMLTADGYIDIIIPRGSQALIDFVRENATVPTIETGAGVCHTYVAESADLQKAADIVVNAKVSRPSVCNALDTILVDGKVAEAFLPMILSGMKEYEVKVYADERAHTILSQHQYPYLQEAEEADFGREFLSYQCSVKVVDTYSTALAHIAKYSSKHSEAIISEDKKLCEHFLRAVDAAAVYANASTRFTDGGVFGLGAEIGISTQKLHARGPFALEKLTTEKWVVRGDGQVR
ncbi:MAG: glutamate-5-semialdehyde dehydrogenase [Bacteroidota bacterium]